MSQVKYGWKRDLYDPRDLKFQVTSPVGLPDQVDLRVNDAPLLNQLTLGSCVSNAFSGIIDNLLKKFGKSFITASRLFTYYNCRLLEGTIKDDSGAYVRDSIKVGAKYGILPESVLPYDVTKFKIKPTKAQYSQALKVLVTEYRRVNNTSLTAVKTVLSLGYPIIFGMEIYESFESDIVNNTGKVPLPKEKEQYLGGHSMMIVGYTKDGNFIVKNSWGNEWGDKGYCYIPFEYLTNAQLASDFWVVTKLNIL